MPNHNGNRVLSSIISKIRISGNRSESRRSPCMTSDTPLPIRAFGIMVNGNRFSLGLVASQSERNCAIAFELTSRKRRRISSIVTGLSLGSSRLSDQTQILASGNGLIIRAKYANERRPRAFFSPKTCLSMSQRGISRAAWFRIRETPARLTERMEASGGKKFS